MSPNPKEKRVHAVSVGASNSFFVSFFFRLTMGVKHGERSAYVARNKVSGKVRLLFFYGSWYLDQLKCNCETIFLD